MKRENLPIDAVEVPEVRITSYFDHDVYEEFKRTVAQVGVIEPIVCVEVGGHYILVDGLHRLQEAKFYGATRVQAVVIPGDEKDVFLTNLFLNAMRGKTKVSEVRRTIDMLINEYKLGIEEIVKKTGLSHDYISDLVAIGKLPAVIQEAFDAGTLSKGAALALTRLRGADLQLRVFAQVTGQIVSVKDIEAIVALLQEEKGERPPPIPRASPTPANEVECDCCHKSGELKLTKTLLICPECEPNLTAWLKEQQTLKEIPE